MVQWSAVRGGRWAKQEHVTLGEGRAAVVLLAWSAGSGRWTVHWGISLCDNLAWEGGSEKGRSPNSRLNKLFRGRSALLVATDMAMTQPWVDTLRMSADSLSRLR